MARSKSLPGSKKSRGDNNNKEQAVAGVSVTLPEVKAVEQTPPAAPTLEPRAAVETKAAREQDPTRQGKSTPAAVAPSEPRKLEVVKNESRKNIVPINLEDEIRRRAYEIYQERGNRSGSEAEDWLAAEREVRQRYRQQSA